MKFRAIQLIVPALILCSFGVAPGFAKASGSDQSASQGPSPEKQTSSTSPTAASPSGQSASPTPGPASPPASQQATPFPTKSPDGEKASPPPKPPILRHTKRKPGAKKAQSNHRTASSKSGSEPKKVVVRNGGEKDESAQLEPAVNPDQARHQRATTERLLAETNAKLKQITARQLTRAEQSTVEEIRTYLRQAKAASAAGDTSRAQTLAYKASLLSNELPPK
ncbi:MAG TPA: hypothetical protein VLW06_02055 [Terriglobales bacterium]|nr:hypothetical protein [Terriglobales bacterium]